MKCPRCKTKLEKAIVSGAEIDYCPTCLGLWFEKDELRIAKDEKDKGLNWLDVDLWQDKKKFKISKKELLCPACELPLYEVEYGDSAIKVDICSVCHGTWLDRGEFKKLIEYLEKKANFEVLENYLKNLAEETVEIFVGPESFKEEVLDFLAVLKLLNYKFAAQHPAITKIISGLPK